MATRREFLKSIYFLSASSLVHSYVIPSHGLIKDLPLKRYFLYPDGTQSVPKPNFRTEPGSLCRLDCLSLEMTRIPIPFYGHIPCQNPALKNVCVLVEKYGKRGVAVDFVSKKIIQEFETGDGKRFYGHIAYSPSGKFFFTTEMDEKANRGAIVVRDSLNMKIVNEWPSYGMYPHDLKITKDGQAVVVANAGTFSTVSLEDTYKHPSFNELNTPFSNLAWIDVSSGKLLRHIDFGNDKTMCLGHFAIDSKGWIVALGSTVTSKFTKGRGYIISPAGIQKEFHPENQPLSDDEFFSVVVDEKSGLAVFSAPKGNQSHLLDYKKNRILKTLDFVVPRAIEISPDKTHVLIGDNSKMSWVNLKQFTVTPNLKIEKLPGTRGSHMIAVGV